MNLNFELYRTFCKVVECRSFTKASEELFISQSAVTQSIKKLESILGEKLFNRNKGGIELTELGNNLYEHIAGSIKVLDNAEEIFSNYSSLNKGFLRLGGGNTLLISLLMGSISEFTKKYPNIKIGIYSGNSEALVEKVSNGEIDLATLNLPYDGKMFANVVIIPVKNSSYCLFASKDFYKERNLKNPKEIEKCKLIIPNKKSSRYKIFRLAFKEFEDNNSVFYEAASSVMVKALVLNNFGIGFCEKKSLDDIKDKIVIVKEYQFDKCSQGIAVLQESSQSKVLKEFLKILKQKYNGFENVK